MPIYEYFVDVDAIERRYFHTLQEANAFCRALAAKTGRLIERRDIYGGRSIVAAPGTREEEQ